MNRRLRSLVVNLTVTQRCSISCSKGHTTGPIWATYIQSISCSKGHTTGPHLSHLYSVHIRYFHILFLQSPFQYHPPTYGRVTSYTAASVTSFDTAKKKEKENENKYINRGGYIRPLTVWYVSIAGNNSIKFRSYFTEKGAPTVSRLWVLRSAAEIPTVATDFSPIPDFQTDCGSHAISYSVGTWYPFQGLKRPGRRCWPVIAV